MRIGIICPVLSGKTTFVATSLTAIGTQATPYPVADVDDAHEFATQLEEEQLDKWRFVDWPRYNKLWNTIISRWAHQAISHNAIVLAHHETALLAADAFPVALVLIPREELGKRIQKLRERDEPIDRVRIKAAKMNRRAAIEWNNLRRLPLYNDIGSAVGDVAREFRTVLDFAPTITPKRVTPAAQKKETDNG